MGPENYGKWELAQGLEVVRQWTERWAVRWDAGALGGVHFCLIFGIRESVCVYVFVPLRERGVTLQNKNFVKRLVPS